MEWVGLCVPTAGSGPGDRRDAASGIQRGGLAGSRMEQATLLRFARRRIGDDGLVDLVMPVKPLHAAKTRLRGAADRGVGDPGAHAALTLALAHDTVAAVLEARAVRRLLVISSDPVVAAELAAVGVEVVPDVTDGLNAALSYGAALLRAADPGARSGRCRPTCPRSRPASSTRPCTTPPRSSPPARAGRSAPMRRAPAPRCCSRRPERTSTRASVPGRRRATARRGPSPLAAGPGLRRDVDTGDDLCAAAELGLGPHTRAVLAPTGRC